MMGVYWWHFGGRAAWVTVRQSCGPPMQVLLMTASGDDSIGMHWVLDADAQHWEQGSLQDPMGGQVDQVRHGALVGWERLPAGTRRGVNVAGPEVACATMLVCPMPQRVWVFTNHLGVDSCS